MSGRGVPSLFEPLDTFEILTLDGGCSHKIAATRDGANYKIAATKGGASRKISGMRSCIALRVTLQLQAKALFKQIPFKMTIFFKKNLAYTHSLSSVI